MDKREKDAVALNEALAQVRGAEARRTEREETAVRMEACRPKDFGVGSRVLVHEAGITDQVGEVHSLKYSGPLNIWYAEVRYESDGLSRSVPTQFVRTEGAE
jgi:hypothetical protein